MELIIVVLLVFYLHGQTTGWLFAKNPTEVCYGSLGCFSSKYPFTNTRRLLPRSPEVIGTKFYLATRNATDNFEELIMTDNHRKCSWKSFCEDNRIILIIHGYMDHAGKPWVKQMVDELLKHDNYNVVVVDWESGAKEINYVQSVANIRVVGAQVAQLLKVFKKVYYIDPSNIHIIGHSLGAHAAGYAGEYLENIGRITGLDPAGPSFESQDPLVRLDKTDAKFVDVIHTDAKTLLKLGFGLNQPCGTVDFYPNSGRDQRGCPNSYREKFDLIFGGNFELVNNFACSHLRALDYFTESINSKCDFLAYPCEKITMFSSRQCTKCGATGCGVMGFHTKTSLTPGKYFLKTNQGAPFCLQ